MIIKLIKYFVVDAYEDVYFHRYKYFSHSKLEIQSVNPSLNDEK